MLSNCLLPGPSSFCYSYCICVDCASYGSELFGSVNVQLLLVVLKMVDFFQFRRIIGFAAAGQKELLVFHGIRHIFAVTDVDDGRMLGEVSLIEPAHAGTARRYVGPIANDSGCSIHGMLLYCRLLIEFKAHEAI